MIAKIQRFCSFFSEHKDCYALLGGAACSVWYMNRRPHFRPTKDVDVVLLIEALSQNASFMERFHEFIERYAYHGESCGLNEQGHLRMFRLLTDHPEVPAQIEILSRKGDIPLLPPHRHTAPLIIENRHTYLSCILMDDEYYHFLRHHVTLREGIPVPTKASLIALKIKAYLNLREVRETATDEKQKQNTIPSEQEMNKHMKDVFFLLTGVQPSEDSTTIPDAIAHDVRQFEKLVRDSVSWIDIAQSLRAHGLDKQLVRNLRADIMLDRLRNLYQMTENT